MLCPKSKAVLYKSLIPGHDHSENLISPGINYLNLSESIDTHKSAKSSYNMNIIKDLPRVRKITIFVDEIYKSIDQSAF